MCHDIVITGGYESALSAVMTQLDRHLSDRDVTADVTEFTFKQMLHDSTQPRDGLFYCICASVFPLQWGSVQFILP